MTAAIHPRQLRQPGDDVGNLLGVTVARMTDIAAIVDDSGAQHAFRHRGRCRGELSVNGVAPKTNVNTAPLPLRQIAAGRKAFTVG